MPQKGLLMSEVREVLRLTWENQLKAREVARVLKISHSTVLLYLNKARKKELTWDIVQTLDDASLRAALLEEEKPTTVSSTSKALPDFAMITQELRNNKHVYLQTLWEEYQAAHCDESYYSYSQYCALYHDFIQKNEPVMLQVYQGGEVLFTDFAGDKAPFTDRSTGEILYAEIFVACMGASNYSFAKAVPSQQQVPWIQCHIQALEFMGGVPLKIVPDNILGAVTKPDIYEAQLNRTFADFGQFYGTCILPARSRKAKVEKGVQIIEGWLLGKLRKRNFFSIAEINHVLMNELLPELNNRLMKKIGKSRKELFEALDRPALRALPPTRYEMAAWKEQKLANSYHLTLEKHLYSAPYRLIGETLTLRYTSDILEIFHGSDRVAVHMRSYEPGKMTTDPLHRPPGHQLHYESKQKAFLGFIQNWAKEIGPATSDLMTGIIAKYSQPELATRSLQGIRSLERKYTAERLEKACSMAVRHQGFNYFSVKSILEKKLDLLQVQKEKKSISVNQILSPPANSSSPSVSTHSNIRGKSYYAKPLFPLLQAPNPNDTGKGGTESC
jgi:transposase